MKVAAVQCPHCSDIIYSRATHDFHSCSCGDTSVDGGQEYLRTCYKPGQPPRIVHIEIPATVKELFDDWNTYGNKFGVIHTQIVKS